MRADGRLAKLAKHQQRKHRGGRAAARVGVASLMLLVNLCKVIITYNAGMKLSLRISVS